MASQIFQMPDVKRIAARHVPTEFCDKPARLLVLSEDADGCKSILNVYEARNTKELVWCLNDAKGGLEYEKKIPGSVFVFKLEQVQA